MVAAANNPFPSILTAEGTTPATPAAGQQRLFVRSSDHVLCYVNSSGTVSAVSTGMNNVLTTTGDIIYSSSGTTAARLAVGTAVQVLHGGASVPAYSAVVEGDLSTSDITTANATTSKHGFTPKYPNDATKYLDGTGAYTVPAGGGGAPAVSYLGYNTIGGTAFTLVNATIYMTKITVAATGILMNVAAYIGLRSGQDGTNSPVWMGVWTDNSGVPLTLLGWGGGYNTGELLLDNLSTAGGLVDRWLGQAVNVPVTPADYWIGFSGGNVATAYHGYKDGSGSDKTVVQTVPVQDIGWVTPTPTSDKISIRALYMATS